MPIPYRATSVVMNTPTSTGTFATLIETWKRSVPIVITAIARSVVANMPPSAIPSRMATRDVGATMYNSRLPVSFSQ